MLRNQRLEDARVGVDGDEQLLRPEARLQDGDREDRRRAVEVGFDVTQVETEKQARDSTKCSKRWCGLKPDSKQE